MNIRVLVADEEVEGYVRPRSMDFDGVIVVVVRDNCCSWILS